MTEIHVLAGPIAFPSTLFRVLRDSTKIMQLNSWVRDIMYIVGVFTWMTTIHCASNYIIRWTLMLHVTMLNTNVLIIWFHVVLYYTESNFCNKIFFQIKVEEPNGQFCSRGCGMWLENKIPSMLFVKHNAFCTFLKTNCTLFPPLTYSRYKCVCVYQTLSVPSLAKKPYM